MSPRPASLVPVEAVGPVAGRGWAVGTGRYLVVRAIAVRVLLVVGTIIERRVRQGADDEGRGLWQLRLDRVADHGASDTPDAPRHRAIDAASALTAPACHALSLRARCRSARRVAQQPPGSFWTRRGPGA